MAASIDNLYVTFLDKYNGLLKIWGQPNRSCGTYIEQQLLHFFPDFNRSSVLPLSSIQKGTVCLAKYEDESFYRAKIISDVMNNSVFVHFIDYGNNDQVEVCNLRMLGSPADGIMSTVGPLAEEYYLANVRLDDDFSKDSMNELKLAVCNKEYNFRVVYQSGNNKLIQMVWQDEDYSAYLMRQDIVKPISIKEQILLLKGYPTNQSMEPLRGAFRGAGFSQPLPSNRDKFFIQNKVPFGATTFEHLHQPRHSKPSHLLSQTLFAQAQNRSGIERHFNVLNPPQRVGFNPTSNNAAYPEAKSGPVINTVVIEALANQLKQHLMKDQLTPVPEASTQGFVSQVLDLKTTHNVYVSYIDDGPWSFSVQLVSNEHELNQLLEDLAAYNFQPIKLPLILGSPCIAKSKKYDSYCRGVLVNITHSAVKVFYVDVGNTEDLPFNMLFEIPPKFFKVKTMSQKFALSGLQRVRPTEEIKKAFIEVVENELLILHVTNLEGENLPTCDLYLKDVNIKKILNEKLRQVKNWDPIQFPRPGEIENVLVTWVESAQKFYVQLKRFEPDLKELKMELAKYGANAEYFDPEEITPGTICICFFTRDKNWCRAVITSINSTKGVTVFYIDYGYTETVDVKMLRKVSAGLITKKKVLAIPCCLHGYEGYCFHSASKTPLIELILEKEFSLKVVSDGIDRINVQLFDNGTDVSLTLKSQSKQNPQSFDTDDKSESYVVESDSFKKRSSLKSIQSFSGKTGLDRMDSGKGGSKNDSRNEKGRGDFLSWRSDDNRKDFASKAIKEPSSDIKSDRYDSGKVGRYCFKGKMNDKDQKNSEKNWRETEHFGGRNFNGDSKNKTTLGESISERMKRVARENEERGLKLPENLITKLPVKLENIALHGHAFIKKEVEVGSTENVIVTYFVNPQEIYLQLVSSKESFRDFMIDVHKYYSTKLPMLNKPKKGDVVIAKFQQDGLHYRALVIEGEPVTVQYVDFGNEEVTQRENLWPMDKRFLEFETQCLKCTLPNLKPVESNDWPTPNAEMDKIFESEIYSCTFLKRLDDGYEVKLVNSDNGADVRDELIFSGFAKSVEDNMENPPPMIKSFTTIYDLICHEVLNILVTYVVDASEFYIQINCNELKIMLEEIRKYAAGEEFEQRMGSVNVNDDDLYLVKVENGDWRRAKVIQKRENGATVRLIDYGNELSVDCGQIGPVPEDLAKYPPQAFQCCLFVDGDNFNSELNKELSSCVKNNFAAFSHEMSDKGLKMTLYDSNGEKIKFLQGHSDAPVSIRPIADLPIINRQMQVTASHINSPKEVYVQLFNDATDLKELRSLMANFYSDKEGLEMAGDLSEFEMYAVKSVSDHSWYRAELLSQDDKSAKMFYIDFGNSEEVPKQNLRKLDSSFYDRYAFAKKVSLNIYYDDDSEIDINDKLRQLIGEKVCTGYFVKVNDTLYAEFDVENSFVTPQLVSGSTQELMVGLFEEYIPKRSGKSTKIFISHADNPREFWVQEEDMCRELSSFQDKLQAACSVGISKDDIAVSDLVAAQSEDKLWYRSLVTSVEGNTVSVRFIDYGKTVVIDKTENAFILLNEELREADPFARKYSLQGCWKNNANSKFQEIVQNNEGRFDLIQIDNNVDLLQNGSSVTEQLAKEGYRKLETKDVFITHINSPSDFYIQRECDQDTFDMVNEKMAKTYLLQDAVDIKVNELYSARYPEDNIWYRAKILSKNENDIVVRFIDYGNCSSVTEIKELPQDLKTLRPLATNCCLINEKPEDSWSEGAKKYLSKFLNNEALQVEVVEQRSELNIVRLTTENGKDLSELLAGVNEDVDSVSEPEPNDNEINGENQVPLLCQEETVCTDRNDTCPSEPDLKSEESPDANTPECDVLPEKTPILPENNTEKNVLGWIGVSEGSFNDGKESECVKKLSHSEKIVPGCITRGLSLEEVSDRSNTETEEKLTHSSLSAPVTPSVARRQQQIYQKIQREDKPLPGPISNGSLSVVAQDEIAHDEEVVANVNGAAEDVQN